MGYSRYDRIRDAGVRKHTTSADRRPYSGERVWQLVTKFARDRVGRREFYTEENMRNDEMERDDIIGNQSYFARRQGSTTQLSIASSFKNRSPGPSLLPSGLPSAWSIQLHVDISMKSRFGER